MTHRSPLSVFAVTALPFALLACGKSPEPAPPPPIAAAPAPAAAISAASAASAALSVVSIPQASTDPDAPTPLSARELQGQGQQAKLSYYYAFRGGPGTLTLHARAKNRPSGATNALTIGLYDEAAKRLCYETAGNSTSDKSFSVSCTLDQEQALILRLDLAEETIDFSASIDGPLTLAAPGTPALAAAAPACSSDIDAPTRLSGARLRDRGNGQPSSHFCSFNAGPGRLRLVADGRNSPAASTEALRVGLYTWRSERICWLALGNTTLEKRVTEDCQFERREPVILRIDTSAETLDWRVRFEGPHDFEPYEPPKEITIALDAAVLFDTGKSQIKPEAAQTLREAAQRIGKFPAAAVAVTGHTDSVGKAAANQLLSEQRAQAVREQLIAEHGLPAERLSAKGFGASQPVADNASEAGRARNRRVDIVISGLAER